MNTDSQWSNQEACFARANQVRFAVNHNTSVQIVLHGQVSLAAAAENHVYVFHELMNGCKNLKIH